VGGGVKKNLEHLGGENGVVKVEEGAFKAPPWSISLGYPFL